MFQHAHGLKVDGIVGTKTLEALHQQNHKPQLTDPNHPDHALYEQALKAVHQAEAGRRIGPGTHSVNLAAALVVEAKREGIVRVDRVELNDDGTLARAVQVNPSRDDPPINKNTDAISTKQAVTQPVRESSEQLEQMNINVQARQAAERNHARSPAFAAP